MVSLIRKLEQDGYLSLNQFVQFLKLHAPEATISYPTALKLVNEGKLRGIKHGSQWRIRRAEVDRWVAEGNWERSPTSPYSPDKDNLFPDFED